MGVIDMEAAKFQSIDAIKKYTELNKQNSTRHQAHILISSRGKNIFNGTLFVCAINSSNKSSFVVEGNTEYARDFAPEYSTESDLFSIIGHTLIIKSKDIHGNDISIDIS